MLLPLNKSIKIEETKELSSELLILTSSVEGKGLSVPNLSSMSPKILTPPRISSPMNHQHHLSSSVTSVISKNHLDHLEANSVSVIPIDSSGNVTTSTNTSSPLNNIIQTTTSTGTNIANNSYNNRSKLPLTVKNLSQLQRLETAAVLMDMSKKVIVTPPNSNPHSPHHNMVTTTNTTSSSSLSINEKQQSIASPVIKVFNQIFFFFI